MQKYIAAHPELFQPCCRTTQTKAHGKVPCGTIGALYEISGLLGKCKQFMCSVHIKRVMRDGFTVRAVEPGELPLG